MQMQSAQQEDSDEHFVAWAFLECDASVDRYEINLRAELNSDCRSLFRY